MSNFDDIRLAVKIFAEIALNQGELIALGKDDLESMRTFVNALNGVYVEIEELENNLKQVYYNNSRLSQGMVGI